VTIAVSSKLLWQREKIRANPWWLAECVVSEHCGGGCTLSSLLAHNL